MNSGIKIGDNSYNVFCYADDVLLTSLTVTGLQSLIDRADAYITGHGLRFNPLKTNCVTYGQTFFEKTPTWFLGSDALCSTDRISYLGAVLSNASADHVNERIKATRKAFYLLQSSGLCCHGVCPNVIAHIWSVALRPILIYGCSALQLNNNHLDRLEKAQASLLKTALGLPKFCRNTQLLSAMNINRVSLSIASSQLNSLKSAITGSSRARHFYLHILRQGKYAKDTLIKRVQLVCSKYDINFLNFLFNQSYARHCKSKLKQCTTDGVIDSIKMLLIDYNDFNRDLVKLLIMPF